MAAKKKRILTKEEKEKRRVSSLARYRRRVAEGVCLLCGGRAEDVSSVFNYKNKEFRLRIAASQSAPLSAGQLRDCLDELYSADRLLKGSGLDEKIILEKCVARLIAKRAVS